MAWDSDGKLAVRKYGNIHERSAFRAGYSDGYHGYSKNSGSEKGWYENAYSAGYWEGNGDRSCK